MNTDERPVLWCFVSYPIIHDTPERWSEPALVALEVAEELKQKGYHVIGPDPAGEEALATFERERLAVEQQRKRKWFEQPD